MSTDRPRTVNALVPDDWPPRREQMEAALLEGFSQHLVGQRDHVVHHAYETIVEQRPYAQGRVHQRPFAALDELNLDDVTRDKIVDIVAVFVDEAMEDFLRLMGSVTNTIGDYYTATYGLTGQLKKHVEPAEIRYSVPALHAAWHQDLESLATSRSTDVDDLQKDEESSDEEAFPAVPIGKGQPLWFDYRKWLSKYCRFRRSARPTH